MDVIRPIVFGGGVHTTFQIKQFYFSELYRMAFTLKREGSAFYQFSLFPPTELLTVYISAAQLRGFIPDYLGAIYKMLNERVAQYYHLCGYPLIPFERYRFGVDAVWCKEFALHFHMGSGGA
jgi:hypothetical protein